MKPWHHCALCLRQLGFGAKRLASRFHCGLRPESQERRRSCRACLAKYYDRVTFADTSGKCAVCLMRLGFGLNRITDRIFGPTSTVKHRRKVASLLHNHRALKVFDAHAAYRKLHPAKPPPPPKPLLRPDWDDRQSRKSQRELTRDLTAKLWEFVKHGKCIRRVEWLIGCSHADFLKHLSEQFTPEMSFANYGSVWELDHFIPQCAFDLRDKLQRHACYNSLNLRPALKHAHRVKSISAPPGIPVFLPPADCRVDPSKLRFPLNSGLD